MNNFRSDVNVDGTINAGDSTVVRNQSGNACSLATTLPK
jgi:hypothetical protein